MEFYSLENTIRSLIDGDGCPSRQECDDLARSLLGGRSVLPFAIQESFSYTVYSPQAIRAIRSGGDEIRQPTTDDKIVQFRLNNSKVDMDLVRLAKAVHGDIAAQTEYCGEIGHEAGTCLEVKQMRMIEEFARYVDVEDFYADYYKPIQLLFMEMLDPLPHLGFIRDW